MIIEFKVSSENAFLLEFGSKYVRFYTQYGRVLTPTGEIYEIATDYTDDDIKNLMYVQNGDVLYLFSKNHPIRTLSRYADANWSLEEFTLKGGPWDAVNTSSITLTSSQEKGITEISASGSLFSEDDVGRLVRLTVTDDEAAVWQASKEFSVGEIVRSDGKYYKNVSKDATKTGNEKPVHTEGKKYDGNVTWEYLHSGYGTARITEFVSENKVKAEILDLMPEGVVLKSTAHWELGLLSKRTGYPTCGTFFRSRFCFMVDIKGIPYVCISNSDDYNNFTDMDFGEVTATNAITIPVYSDRYNESRWLSGSSVLFVGTSGAEYYIDSSSSGSPFGPDNSKIQQISTIGSKAITPVKIGSHIIFVTATGTSIRDIIYSYTTDSYDPIDLGIYGKHLLSSGIVSMKYQEYPDKIIWFAMQDGRLIGMTFSSEQKVNALHQHDLGGAVKSLAVLPSSNTSNEDLWMVVDRDGECIEYLDNGIPMNIPLNENEVDYIKKNAVYLDSCIQGVINSNASEYLDVGIRFLNIDKDFRETINIIDGFGRHTDRIISIASDRTSIRTKFGDILENDTGYKCVFYWTPSVNREYLDIQITPVREYMLVREIIDLETGKVVDTKEVISTDGNVRIELGELPLRTTEVRCTLLTLEQSRRIVKGLSHLEGKEVCIFADGAEMLPQVVENGTIFLNRDVNNILVGLRMKSEYMPQTLIIPVQNGGGVGDVQRIDHVTLTLWNTLGGSVGNSTNEYPIVYRKNTDVMNESTPLFTGNKTIPVSFNTSTIQEKGATVLISNDSAYPMHILCISPKLNTSGNGL